MKQKVAIILLAVIVNSVCAATTTDTTKTYRSILQQQGFKPEANLGVDGKGVPVVCGTGLQPTADLVSAGYDLASSLLPSGVRSWECIPNVIRNDGIDSFRLEVDVNGPVESFLWARIQEDKIVAESGTNFLWLRDDGLNGDRVAGDYIFTSERCRYRADIPMSQHQRSSTNAPVGIYIGDAGDLTVFETNGVDNQFLVAPSFAVLNTNVPAVESVMLASNIQVSAHFINVVTTNREVQRALRLFSSPVVVTKQVYSVLPDAFDFFAHFSTDHLERIGQTTSGNFISGIYYPVQVNYTGTGKPTSKNTTAYGSAGRLLGATVFDIMERGIYDSKNAAHEISHQWSAEVTPSLNITTGDGHYHRNCAINSILGGLYKPVTNASGGILRECFAYSHYEATPLDKYMMGLISTSAVPPTLVSTNILAIPCGSEITNFRSPVTISQIVAAHGVRTPGPATSKKDFRIGFVAGSHHRLLNATEMTFYDLMAAHFTKAIPPSHAPPELSEGWVPVTKFFGEGTTWNSDALDLIRPKITSIESLMNGSIRVLGTGYAGKTYRLMATTNFLQWTAVATNTASANSNLTLLDSNPPRTAPRFYRASANPE